MTGGGLAKRGVDGTEKTSGMTLAVYRLDPATGTRTTVREETRVTGGEPSEVPLGLLPLGAWPLCQCPRSPACRARRKRER